MTDDELDMMLESGQTDVFTQNVSTCKVEVSTVRLSQKLQHVLHLLLQGLWCTRKKTMDDNIQDVLQEAEIQKWFHVAKFQNSPTAAGLSVVATVGDVLTDVPCCFLSLLKLDIRLGKHRTERLVCRVLAADRTESCRPPLQTPAWNHCRYLYSSFIRP